MKSYTPANPEVTDRVAALIAKFHSDLLDQEVKVDCVFAYEDKDGVDAVTLHGMPCYAVVRIVGVKDRAMGRGDTEILIDHNKYQEMSPETRDALLDHELHHLKLKKKQGAPAWDAAGRPCLAMRKHDREFGWFDAIAQRHGAHSIEIRQAEQLKLSVGQLYFGFVSPVGHRAP